MTVYKLRAECLKDVHRLIELLPMSSYSVRQERLEDGGWIPDVTVEINTDVSMEQMKAALRSVVDGHVMLETLALKNEFTGVRKP